MIADCGFLIADQETKTIRTKPMAVSAQPIPKSAIRNDHKNDIIGLT